MMTRRTANWRSILHRRFRWSRLRFQWGRYHYATDPFGNTVHTWWEWEGR